MRFQSVPSPGNRYVQMLRAQPNINNGTTAGGLGHVLQQGMMGMMAGKDRDEEKAKNQRLADALRMMAGQDAQPRPPGMPEGAELTSQASRDAIFGAREANPMGAASMIAGDDPQAAFAMMQAEQQRQQVLAQQQAKTERADRIRAEDIEREEARWGQDAELRRELAQYGLDGRVNQMVQSALLNDRLTRARETDAERREVGLPPAGGTQPAPQPGTPEPTLPEARAAAKALEVGAVEGVKADVAASAKSAENSTSYNAFKTGLDNVESAMSETTTGPIMGRFPALSAEAQTAEGAAATLAPVLKSLFRTAGEGTFTDKDQELLMKMVPTREDHPSARQAKIQMIDDMVRAKLGMPGDMPGIADGPAANLEGVPQGGRPDYVEQDLWGAMTPEERALFRN